ncbi:unnamed protein product [Bursaphelenchus xylophilus]|uniref:Probable ATP-dependent RNA helicase spindle-E n=1 Tax=Bursaphelenchus xylophilus TaxID=6326 RepID=A0A1I7S0T0_BURXY|nr:unnamed protein product [Bursaphelenchus xylophilus]CAG9088388.1 unnamed protein product [Bursaphelenchus xylophilus]
MLDKTYFLQYIPERHHKRILDGMNRRRAGFAGMEDFEAETRAKLLKFRSSKDQEVILPPMTRTERAMVHMIAREFDLRTHSFGHEPHRRTRVTKPFFDRVVGLTDTQDLFLIEEQRDLIREMFQQRPLQLDELEEHQRADLRMRQVHRPGMANKSAEPIVPPATKCSPEMRRFRENLPTFKYRSQILTAIDRNKVTIVTGGTGCGKTTQVPQFLLEEASQCREPIRIVCTQPRRLPAIAVAERVAKERNERLGDTVGYHIRLEQKTSQNTALTYCTSGVLLRMLTVDDIARDITHIILDEVHEREQNTDYLLIVLRQALRKRSDLKVILMSATMEGNRETFANYFQKFELSFIEIPSRLHSVQRYFLGDILAATGYQPQSMFSSGFGDSFGNTFSATEFDYQKPSSSYNQYYDHLHRSTTVPTNLQGCHQTMGHRGYYDSTFFAPQHLGAYNNYPGYAGPVGNYGGHEYGGNMMGSDSAHSYAPQIKGDFNAPSTARFFDPASNRFNMAPLAKEKLIDSYLMSGGAQWTESIDPDLTLEVIRFCLGSPIEGAILVFLPGYDDIMTIRDKVRDLGETIFEPVIFTLHSQMNSQDQQKVFDPVRHGQKKVILSTNIAEASLTIDDVVFVIDGGKVKEKTYDHVSRISQLKVSWIARSNAEQRAGRAGRCRNGYCFRLYSLRDYDQMSATQMAEMKRVAIHDVCLHAKMFAPDNMPVRRFLELAPEPPVPGAIDKSLEFLEQLGALFTSDRLAAFKYNQQKQKEPELTELGRLVAHLPLDPQLARLLLFGLALKCLHPVLGLVAALSHRDPFILPLGEDRSDALAARDKFSQTDLSDHLMLLRALNVYCQQPNTNRSVAFCRQNFISFTAMKMIVGIRKQLFLEMRRLHLVPQDCMSSEDPDLNLFSHSWPMVQGAIVAGCYPGVAFVRSGTKLRKIRTNTGAMSTLHPSSSLRRQVQQPKRTVEPEIEYLAYQELSRIDEGLTLRTVTAVPPMTVALFAGPVKMSKVIVDDFELAEDEYDDVAKEAKEAVPDPLPEKDEMEVDFDSPTDYDALKVERDYYVELENWLGFKGKFKDLQLVLRLRFRFMNYFMNVLKNPLKRLSSEQEEILNTVAKILEMDHKKATFNAVEDVYKQRYIVKRPSDERVEEIREDAPAEHKPRSSFLKIDSHRESEPIPADPSPNAREEPEPSRLSTKPHRNPSERILLQLTQAQNKSQDGRKEEQKLYRPPKSQIRREENKERKEKEEKDEKFKKEKIKSEEIKKEKVLDDVDEKGKRRFKKSKGFLNGAKTADCSADAEILREREKKENENSKQTERASTFFKSVGIRTETESQDVRNCDMKRKDKYVIPACRRGENSGTVGSNLAKNEDGRRNRFRNEEEKGTKEEVERRNGQENENIRRPTVAQRLEQERNGRKPFENGKSRVFRSKTYAQKKERPKEE